MQPLDEVVAVSHSSQPWRPGVLMAAKPIGDLWGVPIASQ